MSDKVTLNKLLSFIPSNEEESNIFNINKQVLLDYLDEVTKSPTSVFYLGGYTKLSSDDEITLSQIEEIINLNNKNIKKINACNSWEMGSLFMSSEKLTDIKIIAEKYQEICKLREK
jgi:hypothetical protein